MSALSPLMWCLFAAILIDLYAGSWFRAGGNVWHPSNVLKRLAEILCRKLDREKRSSRTLLIRGLLGVVFMLGVTAGAGIVIQSTFVNIPLGWVLELAILTSLISMGKPWRDAARLASSLQVGSLEESRRILKDLSDRDATYSNLTEITRVGIEAITAHLVFSLLGPVLSYLILGLPGILMYHGLRVISRCQNASSDFLLFSKRLVSSMDWLLSWVGVTILVLASFLHSSASVVGIFHHWREFLKSSGKFKYGPAKLVIAAAFHITLEGPRQYAERLVERPYLGSSGAEPGPADLQLTARLILFASVLSAFLVIITELSVFW